MRTITGKTSEPTATLRRGPPASIGKIISKARATTKAVAFQA